MVKKMKNFKIVLSVFLSVCLVLTSVQFVPLETADAQQVKDTNISYSNNEIARYNDYPVYKYENVFYKPEYQYYNVQYGTNYGDYYYSDGYFAEDAETSDNEHLYTTSLHFAVAAFSSDYDMNNDSAKNYNNSPKRVLSFLSKTGFQNGKVNSDYYIKPTKDTIGVAAGYRYVKEGDYYVIAAAVRGGDYEAEWVSNVTLGEQGDAGGFNAAADKVNTFLEQYITSNNIPANKLKVWITGYSRGAAVANIEAKNLSNKYGKQNVFGYCLAAPQPALGNGQTYNNIKNVVYDDDLVPRVAPSYMNFTRYGQTKTYSNSTTDMDKYKAELAKFNITVDDNFEQATFHVLNSVINGSGFTPSVTGSKMTQSQYLDELILRLKDWGIIPDRASYSTKKIEDFDSYGVTYEQTFQVLFELMQNSSNNDLLTSLTSSFSGLDGGKYYTLYRMVTLGSESMPFYDKNVFGMTTLFSNGRKSVYDAIWTNFKNNGGTNGMTDSQVSELKRVWYAVCRLAIDFLYNDSGGGGNATFLGTYMYNSKRIDADHYPQKYLAFLRLDDSYYQNGDATINYVTNNGSYYFSSQKSRIGTTAVAAHKIDNARFEGWYLDANFTQPYDHKTYVVKGNFTLYGKWKKYTNVYSWGDNAPADQTVPSNNTQYNSLEEAKNALDQNFKQGTTVVGAKDGKQGIWTFSGWNSSSYDSSTWTTTYNGYWSFSEDKYKIVYSWGSDYPTDEVLPTDAKEYNTVELAKQARDTKYASVIKKNGKQGTRDGIWTFTGWDTGTIDESSKTITYSGKWTFSTDPLDCTVAFIIDGDSGFSTTTVKEGTAIKLSDHTPASRTGYYFDGWYSDTAMTIKAQDSQTIQNHTVFTARWVKQASVVYDWGDVVPSGVEKPTNTQFYNTEELAKASKDTKYGANYEMSGTQDTSVGTWIFSGWDAGTIDPQTKVITFKGSWVFKKHYTVVYSIAGETTVETQIVREGDLIDTTAHMPSEQTDKTFNGWYKDSDLTQSVTSLEIRSDTVFYGKWNNKYTLKYEWDGEAPADQTLPVNNNYYDTIDDAKAALDAGFERDLTITGQKDGENGKWRFNGWIGFSLDHNTNAITYTGQWQFTKDTVSYDLVLNAGLEGVSSETLSFDEGTTVSLNNFVPTDRDGLKFDGWYTDDSYAAGTDLVEVNMVQDTTLYAKWTETATEHTISLVKGDNDITDAVYPKGTTVSLSQFGTPTRSGYTFEGWYKEASFVNKVTTITLDSDVLLYAKWSKVKATVDPTIEIKSFAGSGTLTVNGRTVKAGDKISFEPGKSLSITWKASQVGDNVSILKSLKLNNVETNAIASIDKTKWQVDNTAYQKKMNELAQMTSYEAVVGATQSVSVPTSATQTTVTLDIAFEEYVPVYRLYNTITSEHLFTTDKSEYNSWVEKCNRNEDFWIGEGINWFAPATGTQVYRLYNDALGAMGSSSHYYTADESELKELTTKHGWQKEGVDKGFMSGGTNAIYTCYNQALGSAHHYTSSRTEWEGLEAHGWDIEKDKNIGSGKNGVFQAAINAKP